MIPDFLRRNGGAPSPPGVKAGPNRSRRGNAYLKIPGLTDKQGGHTFTGIYGTDEGRPALMVTGCEITINGKDYGLIVEAAVSFTCNTVGQFNSIQEILKPKHQLTISFGYSDYNPWGSGGHEQFTVTVYKYSFSLNANNQIECTVNGIGRGMGIKSFEVNRTIPSKRGQTVTLANGQSNTMDSILQALKWQAIHQFPESFKNGVLPLTDTATTVPQTGPLGGGIHMYMQPPKETGNQEKGKSANLEPLLMVELGTLLSWINEIINEQDSTANMKYDSLSNVRVIEGICTSDPGQVFFADSYTAAAWTKSTVAETHAALKESDTDGKVYVFYGYSAFAGNMLTSMLISYELLYSIFTEIDNTKAKSESGVERRKAALVTLEDFIAKIGAAINSASGGVYDLRLVSNPDKQLEFHLVDMNDAGNKKPAPTVYRPLAGDGVTRSVEMTGEPDQDMINGALYSKGIKSGTSDKISNTPNPFTAAAAVAKQNILQLVTGASDIKGPGFSSDVLSKLKAEVATYLKGQDPAAANVRMQVPGPLNLGLTVDGNAGFKFGQIITADVVQGISNYDQVCFRVIEVKHSIKDNDWETKVSTVMDIL